MMRELKQLERVLLTVPKEDVDLFHESMTDLNNTLLRYPDLLVAFTKVLVARMTNDR